MGIVAGPGMAYLPCSFQEDYATALGIPAAGLTKPELIAVCLDY
ncbi:MAG: hypothetical protein ACWM05_04610 [Corynebacterium amycolatum]